MAALSRQQTFPYALQGTAQADDLNRQKEAAISPGCADGRHVWSLVRHQSLADGLPV